MNKIVLFLLLFSILKCKLDEKGIYKICSRCEEGFNDTYRNTELLNNTSENDKINEYVITLVEMLKNDSNSSELVDGYVIPRVIYPNIIFFVLIGILIILWIILIILACLNQKCLKFNSDGSNHLKHHILAYITILIFIINIILSALTFPYINKSKTYFNSSVCSLLRLYLDIRNGDQANTTDWEGIEGLQRDLIVDGKDIDELLKVIELQEKVTEELNNNKFLKNDFADEEKSNNYYADIQVTSPSSISNKVYPSYSRHRLEQLTKIGLEYTLKLSSGVTTNNEIRLKNMPIKENPKLITNEYILVNKALSDILESLQDTADKYIQYLIDYSKKINNIAFPLLYSTFILSIIFSFFGMIFTFLYIRDKKLTFKVKHNFAIILHVIWNCILFLLLLTIVSEILFKIFEIFGEDGSGLVQYGTSEENFKSSDSIIFKGAGKTFIEMCLKDDEGDLLDGILKKMDQGSSKLAELKGIVLEEIILAKYYEVMEKVELNETQDIVDELESMNNDYSLITYYSTLISIIKIRCQDDFNELNRYTDYSNPLTSRQSTLIKANHSYDVWTSRKENCADYKNYEYINNKKDRIEGNKYCMVLEEFEKDVAKNFYSGIKVALLEDVDVTFAKYYEGMKAFKEDNKKLLTENPNFIELTKNYYNDLLKLKEKIMEGLGYSKKIVELINKILGSTSTVSFGVDIFGLSNCKFIKRDLKVYYIEMEKLRKNSAPFLILSIFILIPLLASAILAMLNIYKYKSPEEPNIEQIPSDSAIIKD